MVFYKFNKKRFSKQCTYYWYLLNPFTTFVASARFYYFLTLLRRRTEAKAETSADVPFDTPHDRTPMSYSSERSSKTTTTLRIKSSVSHFTEKENTVPYFENYADGSCQQLDLW